MSDKIKQRVFDRIMDAMDKGVAPWKRGFNAPGGMPRNQDGKPYRGVNIFLLGIEQAVRHYKSPYFMTQKNAEKQGGKVKDGERYAMITYWGTIKRRDDDEKGSGPRFLKYYRVYNVEQIEGLPDKFTTEQTKPNEHERIAECERIVAEMPDPPAIEYQGGQPCYQPIADRVYMPELKYYERAEEYYKTLFHELAHSTGHKSRLNRNLVACFGSGKYAREELIAEFAAAFIGAHAQIDADVDNHAAYIKGWQAKIRDAGPKVLFELISAAQKACDRVRGVTWDSKPINTKRPAKADKPAETPEVTTPAPTEKEASHEPALLFV